MGLAGLGSLMTVYYGPGANGSGVAEIIGVMNGINYPGVFGLNTFITKVFGVVFAVVGGLTVGKEGPMAHIGANIGVFTAYLPFKDFDYLRNDVNKRLLIAAGTSAGVSAAFGAPIGGTLFAYEMSKPNTFWRF
jgi:H+/Cl- antiporter ClcA